MSGRAQRTSRYFPSDVRVCVFQRGGGSSVPLGGQFREINRLLNSLPVFPKSKSDMEMGEGGEIGAAAHTTEARRGEGKGTER